MKVKYNEESDRLLYICPGCKHAHSVDAKRWAWNRDTEKPTLQPSVRHFIPAGWHPSKQDYTTCHYFIEDGNIKFCDDSRHELAGQTVPLPDLGPEYLE